MRSTGAHSPRAMTNEKQTMKNGPGRLTGCLLSVCNHSVRGGKMSGGRAGVVLEETLWRHLFIVNSRDRTSVTAWLPIRTPVTLPSGDPPCRDSKRTTPARPSDITGGLRNATKSLDKIILTHPSHMIRMDRNNRDPMSEMISLLLFGLSEGKGRHAVWP